MRRVALGVLSMALLVTLSLPALAEYEWVEPQYIQWRWTKAPDSWVIRGSALLRSSAGTSLLVGFAPPPQGDGYLHLIPPRGAEVGSSTRFGPRLNFSSVATLNDFVYAVADAVDSESGKAPLYELDGQTGKAVRLVAWVDPQARYLLAVERLKEVLVLPDREGNRPDDWRIVSLNPETGEKKILADVPASRGAPIGVTWGRNGSLVVATENDYVTEAGFGDPLGQSIRTRIGGISYGDFAVYYGTGNVCDFWNKFLYTTVDGSLWTSSSEPGASSHRLVARAPNDPSYEPPYTMPIIDSIGGSYFINAMRNEVILFGCPFPGEGDEVSEGAIPPPSGALKNNPPAAPPPPPKVAAALAAPPAAGGPATHAPVQAAAPKAVSQAISPQVTYQASTQAAGQGATAPNAVGLADSTEDDAALSFSATARRREFSTSWSRLAFGALVTTAMAAVAFLLSVPSSVSLVLARKRRD